MPRMLSCPRGHRWEVPAEAVPFAAFSCPECGLGALAVPSENAPSSENQAGVDAATSTVISLEPVRSPPPLYGLDTNRPRITGYEVQGELGRGGMGVVYKARQLAPDRLVAIKVIRKDRLMHGEAVRRFRREAEAAARLAHPNIVLVLDSDHTGDTHFLVMEYVQGINLDRLVEQQGPLPVTQACDYVRQAALGLQHAHEQALVHRDIKPANLMITWGPSLLGKPALPPESKRAGGLVKILDMGVARLYQLEHAPTESFTTLTQGGAVIGTADYIAPEQLEDPHHADIRADLYGLGCTFYYLLTGRVPFPGGTLIQKLDRHRWETPAAVNQFRPEVPGEIVAVVQKLMAKKPGDRFQTPGELAAALTEMAGRGFTSGPNRSVPREPVRRYTGHTDAVGAVALSGEGALALSGGKDGTVRLWDMASGKELRRLGLPNQEVRAVAFMGSDRFLAASGVTLRLFEAASGQELLRLSGHTGAIKALAVSSDGTRAVTGSEDKSIRVWDFPSGRELQRLVGHTAGVNGLALTADDSQLLSAGRDQTLRLWDLRHGKEIRRFAGPRGMVLSAALTSDGRFALSAHFDTVLRLWEVATGKELRRLAGHKQMVNAALFTPCGRRALSASHDRTLRLWDLESGLELALFQGHTAAVNALAVSSDGKIALSGSSDKNLCLWELPQ